MERNCSEIPQRPKQWSRLGTNNTSDCLIVMLICRCYNDACSWVSFLSWPMIQCALLILCCLEMSWGHKDKFHTCELWRITWSPTSPGINTLPYVIPGKVWCLGHNNKCRASLQSVLYLCQGNNYLTFSSSDVWPDCSISLGWGANIFSSSPCK